MRIARCVGGVGFIAAHWLLHACNLPALCVWLSATSLLCAGVYVGAFLAAPAASSAHRVLGRRGARLLALTCGFVLAGAGLVAAGADWLGPGSTFEDGLQVLAWAWALCGMLAAARFLWGRRSAGPVARAPAPEPRHLLVSALIVLVLGLQTAVLFKDRPTFWPFIDYPLYSAAQTTAVRAVHYRLYGVPARGSPFPLEITADALGMSWFVYHTQLIPRLFDRPWLVPESLRRALDEADLPPLRRIETERTTFVMAEGGLTVFPERRPVDIEFGGGEFEVSTREGSSGASTIRTPP